MEGVERETGGGGRGSLKTCDGNEKQSVDDDDCDVSIEVKPFAHRVCIHLCNTKLFIYCRVLIKESFIFVTVTKTRDPGI